VYAIGAVAIFQFGRFVEGKYYEHQRERAVNENVLARTLIKGSVRFPDGNTMISAYANKFPPMVQISRTRRTGDKTECYGFVDYLLNNDSNRSSFDEGESTDDLGSAISRRDWETLPVEVRNQIGAELEIKILNHIDPAAARALLSGSNQK
ncbi:hypothetical protein HY497_01485, partial [Candidatus Woesearchaeota archaeon]|nr:hypothetical protein [Candidatus Woesearchaeota archaeon]